MKQNHNAMKCWVLRKQHASASKDGGGNPSHIRGKFATTTCEIHGYEVKGIKGKQVRCPRPKNKREMTLGCPRCNPE